MAGPALINKWKMWYKMLDATHDGVLSSKDVDATRTIYAELHHFDEEKRKVLFAEFASWWEDFIMRGRTGDVTESDFVDMLAADYKVDKEKFKSQIERCGKAFYHATNSEHGATFSREDYNMVYKAYGHVKIAEDPACFDAYKPVDGKVPLTRMIAAWVEFLTDDDESKNSVIRKEFESHGYL